MAMYWTLYMVFWHWQRLVHIPLQLHEIPTCILCGSLPATVWRETLVAVDAISTAGIVPSTLLRQSSCTRSTRFFPRKQNPVTVLAYFRRIKVGWIDMTCIWNPFVKSATPRSWKSFGCYLLVKLTTWRASRNTWIHFALLNGDSQDYTLDMCMSPPTGLPLLSPWSCRSGNKKRT